MESLSLLLTFIVVALTLPLALLYRRRRRRRAAVVRRRPSTTMKVRDGTVARQALIDHADAFSNRPATPFPVPLITGGGRRGRSHGITTVPYGPHWRALRCNLTATILQPWRQGFLAPLQQDAVDALVAGLLTTCRGGGGDVVVVRDSLYPAVFAVLTRVCFGDGFGEGHVRSMARMMQEFRVAIGEAKVLARSTMARLVNWRRWRRFLAFRRRQVALFAPLIAAARKRRHNDDNDDGGDNGGGVRRPYVDSLVGLRVPDEDDGGRTKRALTEDEMVSLVVEFLGAVESIVAVLEWALAHLVAQPEAQAKLRHEVAAAAAAESSSSSSTSYLRAVVLECLRLHPPFPVVMREVAATETATATTTTVPAAPADGGRMRVQFVLGDIAKDGRVWTDPGEFRPERFVAGGEGEGVGLVPGGGGGARKEMRMMPFGAGQRACPGAAMGVHLISGFLAALVREFVWTAAPAPAVGKEGGAGGGVDMTELYGFITVMKSPLRAHVAPRA